MTITSGLLGAAQVGGGPTAEQLRLVQSLAHGYFGLDVDVATLSPLTAAEFAERVDADDHQRIVDLLVVLEFCRHADEAEQAARIEEYVQALGVDDPFVVVARDASGRRRRPSVLKSMPTTQTDSPMTALEVQFGLHPVG